MLLLPALLLAPLASAAEPEQVTMNLDEFLKLYESTKTRPPTPEGAPRDYALPSAHYKGEVILEGGEPKSAIFDAKLRVEVLKTDGWVRVPILPATVALKSARIGAIEAPLVIEGGWYTLVTNKKGVLELDLQFASSVFTSEGSSGFSFPIAPTGGTTVTLAVPASDALDFTVANARLQSDREDGGRRVVEATLPATGSLAVSWQREIPEAVKEDPRVYAEIYTLVGVGDGLLTATSTIQHTILFAGVDRLKVDVPDDVTLLDVTGNGIRDWSVTNGVLEVALNYAAEGSYPLTIQMEKAVGQGSQTVKAPIPFPLGVERSKGWLGVEAIGNLEIDAGQVKGATPIDVRSLPGAILGITGNPVLLGYKYIGTTAEIPLALSEHEEVDVLVTLLDQAQATTMWTADGRRLTSVRYQVRNNRRQFLRLQLPTGAELWSASVGGRAVQPAKSTDGRVMVPLVRSQSTGGSLAAFNVEVVYVEDGTAPDAAGRGSFAATLPQADAPTTYVGWTVYSPWEAKLAKNSFEGTLRKVDYLSNPISAADVYAIQTQNAQQQRVAGNMADSGGLGQGATPVPVSLPLQGEPTYFEKLLAVDDVLTVSFAYKGLD